MLTQEFEQDLHEVIQEYVQEVTGGLRKVCTSKITPIIDRLSETIEKKGTVFAFGNGGSHSEADAFLYELEQQVGDKFVFNTVGGPGGNEILDTKNEQLFEHTLKRRGREGDAALLVTASGDSVNILRASELCKQIGIRTISISANGRIANTLAAEPNYPIVIPMGDQQKLEEVTLGILVILAKQVGLKLAGKKETIEESRENYLTSINSEASRVITPQLLTNIVEGIILAFRNRGIIRIDATSGVLKAPAEHMAHNLIWDARDETKEIWSNIVLSGLSDCHMTGVGNDGGCGYNCALDLLENGREGDVEILLATNLRSVKTQSLIRAARKQGVSVHSLCFDPEDKLATVGVAQIFAHLTGRLTNTRLLVEQGVIEPDKAKNWMRTHDLALLRKKQETIKKLQKTFGESRRRSAR